MGFKLSGGALNTLTAIVLFAFGLLLLFSYTQSGVLLQELNTYMIELFGAAAFLLPINIMLFSLLLTSIKSRITAPNVPIGFLVASLSILIITQSGAIGQIVFGQASALFGPILTSLLLLISFVIGMIVLFILSFTQLGQFFAQLGNGISSFMKNTIAPLFKTKDKLLVNDITPHEPRIKGLKNDEDMYDEKSGPPITDNKPQVDAPKSGGMSDELVLNQPLEMGVWEYPPTSLLSHHHDKKAERGDVKKTASIIEKTLQSFGIQARVVEINLGPSVTQYAIEIALGTKLSKITSLANDLALATQAHTGQVRIEAPIPGRNLVGIEIPNRNLEIVSLKTMLGSPQIKSQKSRTAVPLGLDVSGNPIIADISRMPHVLIAGTTGSGKSVLVNAFISSLLFRNSPNEVKLILIDPKRVELTAYNDIPHLLTPVVVEADKAVSALKWALKEMDRRYTRFAEAGVRNIDSYNELAGFQALPYIVIFIDELADLMALAPVDVEDSIARLAQMARATGIHLVLATQRPSVDVITGLIKANIPCRIAFSVSSMIDSKVILDTPGAEKLLGRGDMLFIPPEQAKPTRIQGAFVSEQDVKRLINYIKARGIPVNYTEEVVQQKVSMKGKGGGMGDGGDERDELFDEAVKVVVQADKASSSYLQRRLSVGFNRAAKILEQLEAEGIVGPPDGSKPREVLVRSAEEYFQKQNSS